VPKNTVTEIDVILEGTPEKEWEEWQPVITKVCETGLKHLTTFGQDLTYTQKCEISIAFVSKEDIQGLNKEMRGIDKVTDVLSFPAGGEINPENGRVMLGDIVICLDKAAEQSREYGHTLEREVAFLTAHSLLHLLGYDHMSDTEREKMFTIQEEILTLANFVRK
jgi:probable rRNA maturation factor